MIFGHVCLNCWDLSEMKVNIRNFISQIISIILFFNILYCWNVSFMKLLLVCSKIGTWPKGFSTFITFMVFDFLMNCFHMPCQRCACSKFFATFITFMVFDFFMNYFDMQIQLWPWYEFFARIITYIYLPLIFSWTNLIW